MLQHLPTRDKLVIMAATMLGLFVAALDQTVVATALPRMIADLGGLSLLTWVITAYTLSSTTAVPIFGKLSDLFGRKALFIAGIVLFVAASAVCGAAQNMPMLISVRAVQGVGGGMIFANAFALVADLFAPADRPRWQGLVTGTFGLASVIGPVVGGLLTDHLSWRWVFYLNLPVGSLAVLALVRWLPSFRPHESEPQIDYPGFALLVLITVPMLLAFNWAGSTYAWDSPVILGLLAWCGVAAAAFIGHECRAAEPVIPMALFRDPVVAAAMLLSLLVGTAMFASSAFVPLFVQGVLGRSASNSGLVMMPQMVSFVAASLVGGFLVSRLGRYRLVIIAGGGFLSAGTFLLSRVGPATTSVGIVRDLALIGFGLGLMMPNITLAVQNVAPYRVMGAATATATFLRSTAGTMSVAVMGSLLTQRIGVEVPKHLSGAVRASLPAAEVQRFSDPQVLLDPSQTARVKAVFDGLGDAGVTLFRDFAEGLRVALAHSLAASFTLAFVFSLVALAGTFLLRDRALRRAPAAGVPAAAEVPVVEGERVCGGS